MPYDSTPDPYSNPSTGVLYNLPGIESQEILDQIEASISVAVLTALSEHPITGNFDLDHLKDIHKEIFGPIYMRAGAIRTCSIAKGDTVFASPDMIVPAAQSLFKELRQENLLKDLPDNNYFERIAHYYSEVNVLHPFREGNGRTQRAFFEQLASQAGKALAWRKMDPRENIEACAAAYNGNESKLVAMLTKIAEPADESSAP